MVYIVKACGVIYILCRRVGGGGIVDTRSFYDVCLEGGRFSLVDLVTRGLEICAKSR